MVRPSAPTDRSPVWTHASAAGDLDKLMRQLPTTVLESLLRLEQEVAQPRRAIAEPRR
jgi:hypothetical protein